MAETKIEWTERTWNPVVGCSIHSPGCKNCYAMRMAARLEAMAVKPDGDGNPALNHYVGTTESSRRGAVWTGKIGIAPDDAFTAPLRRKKPTDYFVNSMSDLFHKDVPFEVVDRVFAVMALGPQHTYKILTKRSKRMREYMSADGLAERLGAVCIHLYNGMHNRTIAAKALFAALGDRNYAEQPEFVPLPLPNVWLGVSVEDQTRADERIPDLLATPAAVRFLSCEPLLGPVDLRWIAEPDDAKDGVIDALLGCNWIEHERGEEFRPARPGHQDRIMRRWVRSTEADILANSKIDWVIAGGESGPGARPMHPHWARSLRDQCAAAGIPLHFKQWGEWAPIDGPNVRGCFKRSWPSGERPKVTLELLEDNGRRHTHGSIGSPSVYHAYLMARLGKKRAGRLLDGVEHNGFPGQAEGEERK